MLFTVTIISLVGVTLITSSLRENVISSYQESSVSAQYIAEYGLQKAMVSLKDHPNRKSGPYWDQLLDTDIPLDGGSYILNFKERGTNILEIISTGKSRLGESTLKAYVRISKENKAFVNLVSINSQTAKY